jgi:hypothetical protein
VATSNGSNAGGDFIEADTLEEQIGRKSQAVLAQAGCGYDIYWPDMLPPTAG